ncbi:porin [Sphingomonas sp. PR090111-T3T-6A]|uniref:porin n=1 Tax=Sphingomonas sp. PR090111-T3T-6A TaxID=685778 RepID=UPI00036C8F37|nr:porin [Sphingomonas sp. PR090111-T3T-6A]
MNTKLNLLAGAGIGIALVVAGATPAAAATKKKVVHHAAPKADKRDAEIEALRQQIQALTQRLDSTEQSQAQTTAAISAAQTQAASAATAAQAAQTQAAAAQAAVPTEVKTALAKQPKPKNAWANDTTISGRMYFNFSNIDQKSNGVKQAGNGTGFNIKRFYLGVDHTFDSTFSANLTMDASNVVGQTSNGNFNSSAAPGLVGRGFYIKKAYLQAKLNPAFIIRVGSADLPWVPYAENQYGYRHIENTLIDRISFGTSADWGVHVLGDLAGGLLSYQVSVVDGGGYRNVKVTNSVDVEGRISAQYKGAYAAIGGYTGKRGSDVEGSTTHHTAQRGDALIGYKNKLFNIGGEYFYAKNWNSVASVTQDKAEGYSVFGNVNFAPKFSVFGRYDWVRPNKLGTAASQSTNTRDHYYNMGIQYEPTKIVDLAIVYKRDSVDNGTISTQNGTIGGANPAATPLLGGHGTYNEIGVFGQFRF